MDCTSWKLGRVGKGLGLGHGGGQGARQREAGSCRQDLGRACSEGAFLGAGSESARAQGKACVGQMCGMPRSSFHWVCMVHEGRAGQGRLE